VTQTDPKPNKETSSRWPVLPPTPETPKKADKGGQGRTASPGSAKSAQAKPKATDSSPARPKQASSGVAKPKQASAAKQQPKQPGTNQVRQKQPGTGQAKQKQAETSQAKAKQVAETGQNKLLLFKPKQTGAKPAKPEKPVPAKPRQSVSHKAKQPGVSSESVKSRKSGMVPIKLKEPKAGLAPKQPRGRAKNKSLSPPILARVTKFEIEIDDGSYIAPSPAGESVCTRAESLSTRGAESESDAGGWALMDAPPRAERFIDLSALKVMGDGELERSCAECSRPMGYPAHFRFVFFYLNLILLCGLHIALLPVQHYR